MVEARREHLCSSRCGRSYEPTSELASHTRACPLAEEVNATRRTHEVELRAAGIRRLSLFGPAARGDMEPESDVEMAVVFDPAAHIGLFGLSALEQRIGDLIGRKVSLVSEPAEGPRPHASIERGPQACLLNMIRRRPCPMFLRAPGVSRDISRRWIRKVSNGTVLSVTEWIAASA